MASGVDLMRWFQWVRLGGTDSGLPPPDPIDRPGIKKRRGDHRRGNARRSETNAALGMRLEDSPEKRAKLAKMFSGPNTGPVRDLKKLREVK